MSESGISLPSSSSLSSSIAESDLVFATFAEPFGFVAPLVLGVDFALGRVGATRSSSESESLSESARRERLI